ncbi:uncharacterized protein LOC113783477 [Coffea eugenioides]|uniref:DUF7392 domain-containing protein n=1 Tax=Coffea arabica TaxID=13443 RepID=A0A6P6UEK0_COFAR|nr:uncharacterized protein LOC113709689 [Coffea arabica]XP_027185428.1 uncharacterized protein LOC113783477 [Coffea eugenioides]
MACFVPFNTTNMEISLLVFRPTVVEVDDVVEGLKHFSLCTEGLGCLHSAILRSIHGNMIIWYGAWMKRSDENKDSLSAAFSSMLTNVSSMAILIDQSFFEAYAGESREGCQAAKIFTGDIVSLNSTTLSTDDMNKNYFSYACLAIFRTRFLKMEGATAGVCLKSQTMSRVVGLFVWKSLHHCYSYILNTDYRETILPYLEGHSLDIKYDIFRVAYVSSNNAADIQFFSSSRLWQNDVEGKGGCPVTQDFERKGQDIK